MKFKARVDISGFYLESRMSPDEKPVVFYKVDGDPSLLVWKEQVVPTFHGDFNNSIAFKRLGQWHAVVSLQTEYYLSLKDSEKPAARHMWGAMPSAETITRLEAMPGKQWALASQENRLSFMAPLGYEVTMNEPVSSLDIIAAADSDDMEGSPAWKEISSMLSSRAMITGQTKPKRPNATDQAKIVTSMAAILKRYHAANKTLASAEHMVVIEDPTVIVDPIRMDAAQAVAEAGNESALMRARDLSAARSAADAANIKLRVVMEKALSWSNSMPLHDALLTTVLESPLTIMPLQWHDEINLQQSWWNTRDFAKVALKAIEQHINDYNLEVLS